MWHEMLMTHQGSSLSNTIMYPKVAEQQHRGLRMLASTLPIAPGKSFKNPNFVNNFDKYENGVKLFDSMCYKNSCQAHIVESIRLRCPYVIPSLRDQPESYSVTELNCKMCLDNIENKPENNKKRMSEMLQDNVQDISTNSQDLCLRFQHQSFKVRKPPDIDPHLSTVEHTEIPVNEDVSVFLNIKDSQSLFRERQYSVTDSEEYFIIGECKKNDKHLNKHTFGDGGDNSESEESVCIRNRNPSLCESEDSFILFETDDETVLKDDIYSQSNSEDDGEECNDDEDEENSCDEVDTSNSMIDCKKVRFASSDKLCKVHPMIQWSYAYQAARRGPWEMYARDRARFKERILRVERDIQHVFNPEYRTRIYKERFEDIHK